MASKQQRQAEDQGSARRGPTPLVFEQFQGVNTTTTRAGVPDEMAYWIDGFIPLAPRKLRVIPGSSYHTPIYTAPLGLTVICFYFYNIAGVPYMIVFLSNGSAVQVNTSTLVQTTIFTAGFIVLPLIDNIGVDQYADQYLLIVTNQTNGYWVWDGSVLYGAGTIAPEVTLTNTGSGYASVPSVSATGGSGSGATFQATVQGGRVVAVKVLTAGLGYQPGDVVSLVFTGGSPAVSAAGTVNLMPFGVQGTAVRTYQGYVWITAGPRIQHSAPGSVWNFSTAAGGGSATSSDPFLRVGYTQMISANGFLFLLGDSSMNYIAGVTTNTPAGGNPTTIYTNNNTDPEQGTPYPAAVMTEGENLFMVNPNGVFISSGGAFRKISTPLDGVFRSVLPSTNQRSVCKAMIYGRRVLCALVPIIDPITKVNANKLLCWDGRVWFATTQETQLTFVQTQEILSLYLPYGTDGVGIFALFSNPSIEFTKRVQSRLWDAPSGYDHLKSGVSLFAIAQFLGNANQNYTVTVDKETLGHSYSVTINGVSQAGDDRTFAVAPPQAVGQAGVLQGLTVSTDADDLVIVSLALQPEIVGYRA